MRLLILGGNRFIGAALVMLALKRGHDVTVLSLDKPASASATWLQANRNSPLSQLFVKLHFDSVIDNIAYRSKHVESLANSLRDRVNRYVLTSSVDIYCNRIARPCDEIRDERLEPFLHLPGLSSGEAYVRGKRACELALRSFREFQKVIVRPAVVIGAHDNIMFPSNSSVSRSLFFPLRIRDGGPILLRHDDTRLHQVAYVGDVAEALLLAATHPSAAGQIFNVVSDEVWTNEALVKSLLMSVRGPADVVRVSESQLDAGGLADYKTPYFKSSRNLWSLFSNQRLKKLGWKPTPIKVWASSLFEFAESLITGIAEERQKEIHLGQKILRKSSVGMLFPLAGKFSRAKHPLTPIGIGTHRGSPTVRDDLAYFAAIKHAVSGGINLIDTAINYRDMRSEQVVGKAVLSLALEGTPRSSICVVTKGGFIPRSLLKCGRLTESEIAHRHSIKPAYIAESLQQSFRNTELATIDIYLLHNPEVSLEQGGKKRFYDTLVETFAMLEQKVRSGLIGMYGIATWDGLRVAIDHKRHIDLNRVVRCAEVAAGGPSNFGAIELPFNKASREAATVRSQSCRGRLVSTLELAGYRGLVVLTSRSVMGGTADTARSLRLIRAYSQVSCALVGMRQIKHVNRALENL